MNSFLEELERTYTIDDFIVIVKCPIKKFDGTLTKPDISIVQANKKMFNDICAFVEDNEINILTAHSIKFTQLKSYVNSLTKAETFINEHPEILDFDFYFDIKTKTIKKHT